MKYGRNVVRGILNRNRVEYMGFLLNTGVSAFISEDIQDEILIFLNIS